MAELSARYAVALFELSMERGMLDEYLEQSAFLRDTLRGSGCRGILGGPNISAAEKSGFIDAVFAGKIHDDLMGLIRLAVAKNREKFLVPALDEFIRMGERQKGKVEAHVVSAVRLSDSQLLEIKEALCRKTQKDVEISARVDPSVIGGFYVNVDGFCIDRTVKKQLKDMKASIKRSALDDSKA